MIDIEDRNVFDWASDHNYQHLIALFRLDKQDRKAAEIIESKDGINNNILKNPNNFRFDCRIYSGVISDDDMYKMYAETIEKAKNIIENKIKEAGWKIVPNHLRILP